jgi:type IV secretory pathway TraG/TraD family ATPase VirD4
MRRAVSRRPVRPGYPREAGGGFDLTDLGLWALAGGLAVGGVLWVGAVGAALLSGGGVPDGGLVAAVTAAGSLTDPGAAWPTPEQLPGPVVYWTVTALVCALATAVGWALYGLLLTSGADAPGASRLRSLPGLASRAEIAHAAGPQSVQRRGLQARPSLRAGDRAVPPEQVGYRLGRGRGGDLWCSVEDSALLVGPPRMGKGLHVVIPWILDAPGPVVATSTRPDTLAVTYHARRAIGPVAIFDPQQLAGLPGGLRWSPVRGCESPRVALVRARGLAAGGGFTHGLSDADFWAGQTETVLRCLLHAAALDGRRALDLYRWSLSPITAADAVTVLTRSRNAADGWAEALDAAIHADPRTRDSVWLGVRRALAALADPDVLRAVDPEPGEAFDPVAFLSRRSTLYLLASAVTSGSCAPLVAAFVEDITETARARAARSPGARLDPPLLLVLDEIANLTPLPSLPSLMAEGGGSGITTLAVLQSLAQARHRWGEHAADAIWDAATVKLVLGGLGKARDLDDVARLLGEIDAPTTTFSRGRNGERSQSMTTRQVPVLPASMLRTLPFGTAVLLLRHTRPAVIDLSAWTSRPDAERLRAGQAEIERATASGTEPGGLPVPGGPR